MSQNKKHLGWFDRSVAVLLLAGVATVCVAGFVRVIMAGSNEPDVALQAPTTPPAQSDTHGAAV